MMTRRIGQAWLLLVAIGSLQPVRPEKLLWLHREIHWLAFAVAAFLLVLPAQTRRRAIQRGTAIFLLGLFLEILQHFLYHKTVEWLDVADDATAIVAAFVIYWFAIRPRTAWPERS